MSLRKQSTQVLQSQHSQGFTLIEVMISLLILAVGMLGMTALQNESLKFNHTAFIDSQAQFLLNDMAERIRANRGNVSYSILYTQPAPTQTVNCETATCSSNDMAIYDLNQWRTKIIDPRYLPQGESSISYDALTSVFTISIRYDWSSLGGVDLTAGKRTVSITTRI